MNYLKMILAIGFMCNLAVLTAQQEEAYVAAESGLSLRDQPDISAKMLSKLVYGEAIGIIEKTNKKLVVLDGGEKVSGEWVKVETRNHIGYVFNGYLSPNKIARTIRLNLDKVKVEVKNIATSDYKRTHDLKSEDKATINVDASDSPEGKNIVLVDNDYKHVSLFQRYENSFSFMSSDVKCNTNEWKQFDTEWKPLKQLKTNTFETSTYTERDWINFIETATKDLKDDVVDKCGEDWLAYVKTIENVKDFPVSVSTNRVFIKFILTDFEDNVTEKIIEFKIPKRS
ncbi:SH3 domain-containing protein [Winogradskyella luteola]|uniref:SH3 domain-containing protein n=1 Tax=Winogradskyella luteola TaxID=2828330 RepID=A0A9X1JRU6_9FLAO|nr:SH3 domain-containing protein [Winogradskyella luteola]MBV7268957.1 SH3 domain-containing protein [Winogradskyella luteola]